MSWFLVLHFNEAGKKSCLWPKRLVKYKIWLVELLWPFWGVMTIRVSLCTVCDDKELPQMLHELVLTLWLLLHDYSIDLFSFTVFVSMVRVCQVLDSTVALLLLLLV